MQVVTFVQQRVRRAVNLSTLGAEIDAAISADRGIARPLIAGQGDEAVVLLVLRAV
ncbi:MAG: hypothetical protein R3E68_02600 [Burkholderiaceae bacterium]